MSRQAEQAAWQRGLSALARCDDGSPVAFAAWLMELHQIAEARRARAARLVARTASRRGWMATASAEALRRAENACRNALAALQPQAARR